MVDPVDFLTRALSASGSEALPYGENQKWTIRQQLADLLTEFPSLRPSVQTYTQNNGRTVRLLRAQGTLPMYHQGHKYNIPVAVWLPEQYPTQPPQLFVEPTADMMISPGHSFVDASGGVRSSYIVSWDASRSNLVDMAHDTSIQFGEAPPLFAKPPGWTEPQAAGPAAHPSHMNGHHASDSMGADFPEEEVFQQNPMISRPGGSAHSSFSRDTGPSGRGSPAVNDDGGSLWSGALSAAQQEERQRHQQQRQQQQQQQHEPPGAVDRASDVGIATAEDLQGEFRRAAIACLSRRLQVSLASAASQAAGDTNQLLETQTELTQRGTHLQMAIEDMTRERHVLEACVAELNTKGREVERWLAANEAKTPSGDIDPDAAIVAADTLCAQALEAQAEDMAVEDTLYALERSFQSGGLAADVYLKQVRMLCGKQFYVRALGMKIAALQHRHGTPPPPPPLPAAAAGSRHAARLESAGSVGRPVQMHLGDSWTSTGIVANPLSSGS